MNCCDYDCNQGRDCPARASVCKRCHGIGYDASGQHCTCRQPTKVARIGRKDYAREPLPVSASRTYLRDLAKWMLIVLALLLAMALASGVAHA